MKHFFKVFITSLILFSLVATAGIFTYVKYFSPEHIAEADPGNDDDEQDDNIDKESETPLEKAMRESNRINVLVGGFEGTRSDTIMLASFDRKTKEASIISIPRDTYFYREAYGRYEDTQKINAVYGTNKEDGMKALTEAIEELTGIPIHNYVKVDYKGVRAAVDAIGGVEVDVKFNMVYSDPYDNPPLYINIPAGTKMIYGDKSVEFLRYRAGYPDGDLGRIKAQQGFMKSAIKKSLSLKLPSVISAVYPYVETDLTLTDLLGLGKDAIGFSMENLDTLTLPGGAKTMGGLSFYIVDGEKTTELLYGMYGINLSAAADEEVQSN